MRLRKGTSGATPEGAEETTDGTAAEETTAAAAAPRRTRSPGGARVWRGRIAQVLWTICVLLALVLAVGALLVAIGANEDNGLVKFVLDTADKVDLGVFSRDNGIREFTGDNAETKNALFNWGLGAIAYLVVGRVLERVVRPGRA